LFDFVLFLHSSTFNWTNPKLNLFLIPPQLLHSFSRRRQQQYVGATLHVGDLMIGQAPNIFCPLTAGKKRLATMLDMGTFNYSQPFLVNTERWRENHTMAKI
jgi:hypothetical protein